LTIAHTGMLGGKRLGRLLSALSRERATGVLRLGKHGVLLLKGGEIVSATFGPMKGTDALENLFLIEGARFVFTSDEVLERPVIMSTEEVISCGHEQQERWKGVAPLVLQLVQEPEGLTVAQAHMLTLLDGTRTVSEALRHTTLMPTQVLDLIVRSVEGDVLHPGSPLDPSLTPSLWHDRKPNKVAISKRNTMSAASVALAPESDEPPSMGADILAARMVVAEPDNLVAPPSFFTPSGVRREPTTVPAPLPAAKVEDKAGPTEVDAPVALWLGTAGLIIGCLALLGVGLSLSQHLFDADPQSVQVDEPGAEGLSAVLVVHGAGQAAVVLARVETRLIDEGVDRDLIEGVTSPMLQELGEADGLELYPLATYNFLLLRSGRTSERATLAAELLDAHWSGSLRP
jgi:hypothetical protein